MLTCSSEDNDADSLYGISDCRQIFDINDNYYYSSSATSAPYYVKTTCTGLSPTAFPTKAPTAAPSNPTMAPTVIPTPAATAITGSVYLYTLTCKDDKCSTVLSGTATLLNQCVLSESGNPYQKSVAYKDSSNVISSMIIYYSDSACTTVVPNTDGSPYVYNRATASASFGIAASGSTGLPSGGYVMR
jgi:hypothetical protein